MRVAGTVSQNRLMISEWQVVYVFINQISKGSRIFYWQTRIRFRGCIFQMPKFRIMIKAAEADGQARWVTSNDERVTWVGRFLRRSWLDEVP